MTATNRIAFRIFGLFALIAGVIYVSIIISELGKIATAKNFIIQFISLVVNCIAIYGGFQLLKLKEIGRRSLIIWVYCQILTIVVVVFGFVFSSIFSGGFQFSTSAKIPMPLIISFYLFCVVALIYLLLNRISKESIHEDNRYWRMVATVLSLLTPGLGRALVGNLFTGMILFYIYGLLLTATVAFDSNPEYLNWVGQFLYYLVVWRIFSTIDRSAVKHFENSEQRKIEPAPDYSPGQVNGG